MNHKRIAVIGAGPSGCAVLRSFASAKEKGEDVPEIICFEKQSDLGGLWNYNWRTGLDEYGESVHGSMYRYLWANGPKECLEFADYSFEEHFGKAIPSYPPREVLFDYIKGRINKSMVKDQIKFNTVVRNIGSIKTENGDAFMVISENLVSKKQNNEIFDNVIVCSGHFSVPNMPYYPGFDKFKGRILHAHDFRDAVEFKDKTILIVGSSYSAEDIGSQCYKYGTKKIICTSRSGSMGYKWPENWEELSLLTHVDGNTIYFSNGQHRDVEAIILCTGYQHHFPFLSNNLRLQTNNRLWVKDLYKGVVFIEDPNIFYIGMQDQYYTFNMFDAQAWYVRDIILNRIILPSKEEMIRDSNNWLEKESLLKNYHDEIDFQGDYTQDLINCTDYPDFDINGVNEMFKKWKSDKKESIMGYRDKSFKSILTGNLSPVHHTPWLDALDDSMKSYLESS